MSDTIAAIATATGGPIGIIRVSGEQAFEIVSKLFQPANKKDLCSAQSHRMIYGKLFSREGKMIDTCLVCIMRAPHSYTGENMAEIQCHGSPAVLTEALHALFSHEARQARAGEFTQRAFLNNKMELTGAEAVQQLISAQTVQAASNAAAQVVGTLDAEISAVRARLIEMVAHFHAVVDFPDEEIDPFLFDQAQEILHGAASRFYAFAESYERGRILADGVPCVILGRPNAGKSSLLNAMVGDNRAIVTDQPGTTRDVIDATVRVGAVVLHVMDTAGLRDTTDCAEKEGIDRALKQASKASVLLAVFDGADSLSDEDLMVIARSHERRAIAIVNKADLPQQLDINELHKHFKRIIHVSAKTGDGIKNLESTIVSMVGMDGVEFDGSIVTSARQAAALTRAAARCEEALFAAETGMTPDAVVMDAEGAIAMLGEITGENVTEEIVSKIFSSFCVGK